MVRLTTEAPGSLHPLSLIVRERLEDALQTRAGERRARRLRGSVGFFAGGMATRLRFDGRTVHLDQGSLDDTQAAARGTLAAFLALCQGRIGPVELVRGKVSLRGSPRLLLRVLPLLRVEAGRAG